MPPSHGRSGAALSISVDNESSIRAAKYYSMTRFTLERLAAIDSTSVWLDPDVVDWIRAQQQNAEDLSETVE